MRCIEVEFTAIWATEVNERTHSATHKKFNTEIQIFLRCVRIFNPSHSYLYQYILFPFFSLSLSTTSSLLSSTTSNSPIWVNFLTKLYTNSICSVISVSFHIGHASAQKSASKSINRKTTRVNWIEFEDEHLNIKYHSGTLHCWKLQYLIEKGTIYV